MATVTSLTAARMEAIEAASIVDGSVVGDNLILERFDETTIDAGSVRGPTGSPGVTTGELADVFASLMPVGSIVDYIGTTPPTNWLTMTGQTITNGESIHPELWAVLPASMKSGANIIMPNTKGRVSVGYDATQTEFDTIGETGGSKTHTLTQAQLPAASVTVNPPSTAVAISDPGHMHQSQYVGIRYGDSGSNVLIPVDYHSIDDYQIESSTVETGITASVDIGQFASGNMGSGESHSIVQPYVTFLKIIKAL